MKRQECQVRIRLPVAVRQWVVESAERNYRSFNAEIVFWLSAAKKDISDSRPTAGTPAAGEASRA